MNVRSKTVCAASALLIACLVAGGGEFSWIQITDIHYPHADSAEFLESLAGLGPVPIGGDDLAPAPSFVLATGDLFEFSHGYGWWEGFIRGYGAEPEHKRLLLYAVMQCLCAAMGCYMQPEAPGNAAWRERALAEVEGMLQELRALS